MRLVALNEMFEKELPWKIIKIVSLSSVPLPKSHHITICPHHHVWCVQSDLELSRSYHFGRTIWWVVLLATFHSARVLQTMCWMDSWTRIWVHVFAGSRSWQAHTDDTSLEGHNGGFILVTNVPPGSTGSAPPTRPGLDWDSRGGYYYCLGKVARECWCIGLIVVFAGILAQQLPQQYTCPTWLR